MSPHQNKRREKVAILLASEPNFDEFALKYFILSANKIQPSYEFEFPEIDDYPYNKGFYTCDFLFSHFSEVKQKISFEGEPDYFINIVKSEIEGNLFWEWDGNVAFITTDVWERLFSPPSLFEYLIHSISAVLISMHPKVGLDSHLETRGCALDYTRYKMDNKVDISLGYLCDNCRRIISDGAGPDYLESISTIINGNWIGDINTFDSVAHNLKHFFKFDINKDSGFNKTFWERSKEHFPEIPKAFLVALISAIVGAVIAFCATYFTS